MNRAAALRAITGALLCPFALAQGPDPQLLPADTVFVAHLDLHALVGFVGEDRLRAILNDEETSPVDIVGLFEATMQLWTGEGAPTPARERQPRAPDEFDRLQKEWGVNAFRDLQSFTLFGTDGREGAGVLLVLASAGVDKALERLRREGALQNDARAGLAIERLSLDALARLLGEAGAKGEPDRPVWVFVEPIEPGRRAIALSLQPEHVVVAAKTLRRELPTLAQAPQRSLELRTA